MKRYARFLFLLLLPVATLFYACSDDDSYTSAKNATLTMLTDAEIVLEPESGSEGTVSFECSRDWTATTTASWLEITPSSGDANETALVTITATSENTDDDTDRTATVTITYGSKTQDITVTQLRGEYVYLATDTFYVSQSGGAVTIDLATNITNEIIYSASSTNNWLTVRQTGTRSLDTNAYATVYAAENTGSQRKGYVNFYKVGTVNTLKATAVVIQYAADDDTDYSADKTVDTLQLATVGKGLNIILMGDGFTDTHITDGTYAKVMEKTMENFFTEEPYTTLRDYFNVYSVIAVSRDTLFGDDYDTAFSSSFESSSSSRITGDVTTVQKYAAAVNGVTVNDALIIVVLNSTQYGGTTYIGFYTSGGTYYNMGIAFCAMIYGLDSETFREVICHEAGGHGFGKLLDEYYYESNGAINTSTIEQVEKYHTLGWGQNVDITSDPTEVVWADFIDDSRYDSEGIGVYEGACTYATGAYRPTYESMMRSNKTGFNAPSRKAIYDMVMSRATGEDKDYEDFVTFDSSTQADLKASTRSVASTPAFMPFASPIFVNEAPLDLQ